MKIEIGELLKIKLDPIEELIVEEKIVLNPIYFEFDKANITNQAAFELDKLVSIMKKYPKMIIEQNHILIVEDLHHIINYFQIEGQNQQLNT